MASNVLSIEDHKLIFLFLKIYLREAVRGTAIIEADRKKAHAHVAREAKASKDRVREEERVQHFTAQAEQVPPGKHHAYPELHCYFIETPSLPTPPVPLSLYLPQYFICLLGLKLNLTGGKLKVAQATHLGSTAMKEKGGLGILSNYNFV